MTESTAPGQTAHERNTIRSLNSLLASGLDAYIDKVSGIVMVARSKPNSNNGIGIDDNGPQSALGAFRYKAAVHTSIPELNRRVAERAASVASNHFDRQTTEIVFIERTDSTYCIQDFDYEIAGFTYPFKGDNVAYIVADKSVTPSSIETAVMHEICHLATQESESAVQAATRKLTALYGLYNVDEGNQSDTRQTDYSANYFQPIKQKMQWANY